MATIGAVPRIPISGGDRLLRVAATACRFNSVGNPELVEEAGHGYPVMGTTATCPWEGRNAAGDAIVPHAVIRLPEEWSHRCW